MKLLPLSSARIDSRIEALFGAKLKKRLVVNQVAIPAYRYVDIFKAVEAALENRPDLKKIETVHEETLAQLIHGEKPRWADRRIQQATRIPWPTSATDETYLPIDCFWLCPPSDIGEGLIVRLYFQEQRHEAKFEVASGDGDAGRDFLETVLDQSKRNSIYRAHVLHLAYSAGTKDEYGDIEKPERLLVSFSAVEPVTDEDIVLTDEHLRVLKRNVIDLHTKREVLENNGVTARRGVLLHGPPGTGKTFACRYLCHKLEGITRIFVSGSSLQHVGAVFSFARLMQPAVLFLEDVDLVFASREINLYSSALGDLLDQMDGLRSHETISVVLTTNAIDRLEAAIKDRPGRISQCVYMGAPAERQRKLFLQHQLTKHQAGEVDLDWLVAETDGATQAFLKEWVRRAVQIACERLKRPTEKASVTTKDFSVALDEMRQFLDGAAGMIIGFQAR